MGPTVSICPKFCTAANLKNKISACKGFQLPLWLPCALCLFSIHWWFKVLFDTEVIRVVTERCGPSFEPFGVLVWCLGHVPESKSSATTEILSAVAVLLFELCLQQWFWVYNWFWRILRGRGRGHFPQLEDQFQEKETEQLPTTWQSGQNQFGDFFLLLLLF